MVSLLPTFTQICQNTLSVNPNVYTRNRSKSHSIIIQRRLAKHVKEVILTNKCPNNKVDCS